MSQPDLNLLRVLDVLLEERSVTRAGARLGLSQSAVSHALNRLRHMLDDPLFVRGPSGIRPTAKAMEIGAGVHLALNQLQSVLSPPDFDPATTTRRFNLVAGTYASGVLAPPLATRIAELAPMAELAVTDYSADILDLLDAREVDFVIGGVLSAPERFGRERLMQEELAWVTSADAPLAQREHVDLKALVETPHVVVARRPFGVSDDQMLRRGVVFRASWEDAGAFEAALSASGLTRRVGVYVPDTYSALAVARRSHMATLAPRRLALAAQTAGLALIPPPYMSPPVEIGIMYLRDRLQDPAMSWFRDLMVEVAAGL